VSVAPPATGGPAADRAERAAWTWSAAVAAILAAAGVAALLARPALLPARGDPTARLVWLFVLLGTVGAAWPVPASSASSAPSASPPAPPVGVAVRALALGAAAFVVGRLLTGGIAAAHPLFVRSLALNALAAVAEEAFFRRLLYGLVAPLGPTAAVVVSAAAFAMAHVTVWGWWVLPLDLAAGLLLSWQRAASGRWWVPAATHVLANALALL
jgi:membrane protease YdiL (CAAX protease family)